MHSKLSQIRKQLTIIKMKPKKNTPKKAAIKRTSVKQCKELIRQASMIITAYQLMSPYKNPILSQAIKTFTDQASKLN